MAYLTGDTEDDQDELLDSLLVDPSGARGMAATPGATDLAFLEPEGPPADLSAQLANAAAGHDALEAQRAAKAADYMQAATTEPSESVGGKIGNFLSDSGTGILATLLDAGFNKGRAIPQILTQTSQMVAEGAQRRGAEQDRAMDFQLRAQQQRAANARADRAGEQEADYRKSLQRHWAAQEANSSRGIGLRERAQGLRDKKFALENDPNHPAVMDWKERLYASGVPRGSLDSATMAVLRTDPTYRGQVDLFFQEQGIPLEAREAAATGRARTQAELAVETSPEAIAARSAAAGAVSAATSKGRQVGAQEGKAATDQIIDAERLLAQNPQIKAADPTLVQQGVNKLGKDFITQVQSAGRSANIIQGMYDTKKRFDELAARTARGEISPMQAMEMASALSTTWHGHAEEFAGALQKISGTSSDAGKKAAMELVPSIMSPFGDDKLIGLWETINENIKSNLGVYGVSAASPSFMSTGTAQGVHNLAPAGGYAAPGAGHGAPAAPAPKRRPTTAPTVPAAAEAKPFKGGTATRNPDGTFTIKDASGAVRKQNAPANWVTGVFQQGGGSIQ